MRRNARVAFVLCGFAHPKLRR